MPWGTPFHAAVTDPSPGPGPVFPGLSFPTKEKQCIRYRRETERWPSLGLRKPEERFAEPKD